MHLRLGAKDIPQGHITIARIYMTEGDQLSAAEELRIYLKSGENSHRADVERWLAKIQGD